MNKMERTHQVDSMDCAECWPEFPREHKDCPGLKMPGVGAGLFHAEFGDEDFDGDYWLVTECSVCGETYDP